jgi:hypothetical protein
VRSQRRPVIRAAVRFTVPGVRSDAKLYSAKSLVLIFAVIVRCVPSVLASEADRCEIA